jgi:hypothetical protein
MATASVKAVGAATLKAPVVLTFKANRENDD